MKIYKYQLLLILLIFNNIIKSYGYDEIQTQLERYWTKEDVNFNINNKCLKKDMNFDNEIYFNNFIKTNPIEGLSSNFRDKATCFLLKASLVLDKGDIVETGVYKGHSSFLIMSLLLQYDGCNKKYWVGNLTNITIYYLYLISL
jgi:hypothetical protein